MMKKKAPQNGMVIFSGVFCGAGVVLCRGKLL